MAKSGKRINQTIFNLWEWNPRYHTHQFCHSEVDGETDLKFHNRKHLKQNMHVCFSSISCRVVKSNAKPCCSSVTHFLLLQDWVISCTIKYFLQYQIFRAVSNQKQLFYLPRSVHFLCGRPLTHFRFGSRYSFFLWSTCVMNFISVNGKAK